MICFMVALAHEVHTQIGRPVMDQASVTAVETTPTPRPHEPVMIRFVSEVTGHAYDPQMVDHLADMVLIFYAGGGTAMGAIAGACIAAYLFPAGNDMSRVFETIPLGGLIGGFAGALLVFVILNLRGLVKWDGLQVSRTYKTKSQ
jgi:hypothetical protein